MRFNWMLCVVLGLVTTGYAKDPKPYLTGTLLQMDSVQCGLVERASANAGDETQSADSNKEKNHRLLCTEYVLQSDQVIYHIRPRDEKHPVLLPVGDGAQFRLERSKMLLRAEGSHAKEREYTVVSMTPRSESSTADATVFRLNHLQ